MNEFLKAEHIVHLPANHGAHKVKQTFVPTHSVKPYNK